MTARRNWDDREVGEALALYLRLPFGQFDQRNTQVRALAARIGRTPSAVALKLANLAALDDSLPQKGMGNASATDRRVWAAFLQDPAPVVAAYEAQTTAAPQPGFSETARVAWESKQDETRTAVTKIRRGQAFFRDMILTSYRGKCALTGVEDSRLLNASHIIGWQEDVNLRLNPTNGICLNALHDRAFDRHLISFDDDYRMIIAADIPPETKKILSLGIHSQIKLPEKFLPDPAFLDHHRQRMQARSTAA